MKIISWNCNGKFRDKYKFIMKEDADVYVIQECENPLRYPEILTGFCSKYKWCGLCENKGLAIFVKDDVVIQDNNWATYCLRHFISVKINNKYDLVGVWASPPYIEEYYIYQSINIDKYTEDTILIGDFNSNAQWDKQHKERNHSIVVKELGNKNIVSAYHYFTDEKFGQETQPTFYLYRNKNKSYHIDYCFANKKHLKKFEILNIEEVLSYSDHLPIQVLLQ